jgi:hypothetical protein
MDAAPPSKDDVAVCFYCASILVFETRSRLRLATQRDIDAMSAEQRAVVLRAVAAIAPAPASGT